MHTFKNNFYLLHRVNNNVLKKKKSKVQVRVWELIPNQILSIKNQPNGYKQRRYR